MSAINWLRLPQKRLLKWIPLFGRLAEVPKDAGMEALWETLTTTLFATMPFWILPVIGHFILIPRPSFWDTMHGGEGLVYAAALLGPLVYILTRRYGRYSFRPDKGELLPLSVRFPYGGLFSTLTIIACVIAGSTFAIVASDKPSDLNINHSGILTLSSFLMIAATVVLFLVTAYRNMLDSIDERAAEKIVDEQPRQEEEFSAEWQRAKS